MANILVPKTGGRVRITGVSAPTAHTISITSELPWYASASTSGADKLVDLPANTYRERSFTLSASGITATDSSYEGTASIFSSWTVTQAGNSIDITSTSPIDATATTMSYTVTATNNCRVRLSGGQIPTFVQRDHSSGTSTGSFTISANTETYELYYTLDAWILENVSVEKVLSLTQAGAAPKYVTGVSISNVQQVTDIPATGGTATYQNFSYIVHLNYNDGTYDDITSTADMSQSTTVTASANTSTARRSVGVINIIATYYDGPNPFSSTAAAYVYQAGSSLLTPTITEISATVTNNPDPSVGGYITMNVHNNSSTAVDIEVQLTDNIGGDDAFSYNGLLAGESYSEDLDYSTNSSTVSITYYNIAGPTVNVSISYNGSTTSGYVVGGQDDTITLNNVSIGSGTCEITITNYNG